MMSQTHLIFGLTAFGKPMSARVTAAALAGSFIPDASLYLLAGTHLLVLGTPPEVVFDELYFSEGWQAIFRIDNSFVIWAMALALAVGLKSKVAMALCGAALLHLLLDFPLHNDDARAHFWPISNWKFLSPVSYWDPRYYGHIVGPVEVITSLIACGWLALRFKGRAMRALIGLLAVLQILAGTAMILFVLG